MSTEEMFNRNSAEIINFLFEYQNSINKNEIIRNYINNINNSAWNLISTILLVSENTISDEQIYNMIEEKQCNMFENFLEKSKTDDDYKMFEVKLLDDENNFANILLNITKETITDNKKLEEELDFYYKDEEYDIDDTDFITSLYEIGCNNAILTNKELDFKKLFIRIRNSIAHSNYEILDTETIRLYHYDENNKLDFNIEINKEVVLIIINEINEKSLTLEKPFFEDYNKRDEIIDNYIKDDTNDDLIKDYFLKYKILSEQEIQETIDIVNLDNTDVRENYYVKFDLLFSMTSEKIEELHQYAILLNEIIHQNTGKKESYLYDMFGYYNFFLNDDIENAIFESKRYETYLKIIILSLLNSVFLYQYNTNEEINYQNIMFDSLKIDEKIKEKYKNSKYKK